MKTQAIVLFVVVWTGYLVTRMAGKRTAKAIGSPLCSPVSAQTETELSPERKSRLDRLNCSSPDSLARLEVDNHQGRFRVTIFACPNVTQFIMRVTGPASLGRGSGSSHMRRLSCQREGDTVAVTHPSSVQRLWLMPSRKFSNKPIGLAWSHQHQLLTGRLQWSPRVDEGVLLVDSNHRNKRSNAVNKQATKVVKLQKLQGCGKRKSCVRFGPKGCSHLECDYLLSYSITNHTFLELEISGKTDGWVALGLSSDDKMGGDGVIVCKKRSQLNSDLEAVSMSMSVPYYKPKPRPVNDISLKDQRIQDGHIYCKITKVLTDEVESSGTGLDLTNNWFQFYAKGNIDHNGVMLKHSKTPPTSLDTTSMLRPNHVESLQYAQLSSSAPSSQRSLWLQPYFLAFISIPLLTLVILKR